MTYRLIPQAQDDFEQIYIYLHSENAAAADRLATALIRSYKFLAEWPNAGHLRSDLPDTRFRFWPVSNYIVLYAPDTTPLSIVAILHGAQNISQILNDRFLTE